MPRFTDPHWLDIIRSTPLVSIDLILRNPAGQVLLGLRNNQPAQGSWFVPGGAIRKDETLDQAFARIASTELGLNLQRSQAELQGVYEHFYPTNFAGASGVTTHYVVIAHRITLPHVTITPADHQHQHFKWMQPVEILASREVHPNTQAYFGHGQHPTLASAHDADQAFQ